MTASSIGVLLKAGGWRVTSIKIDPYINIDAGTMSPFEHGGGVCAGRWREAPTWTLATTSAS